MQSDPSLALRPVKVERNEKWIGELFVHTHTKATGPAKGASLLGRDICVLLNVSSTCVDDVVFNRGVSCQSRYIFVADTSYAFERQCPITYVLRHDDRRTCISVVALMKHAAEWPGYDVGYLAKVCASQGAPS